MQQRLMAVVVCTAALVAGVQGTARAQGVPRREAAIALAESRLRDAHDRFLQALARAGRDASDAEQLRTQAAERFEALAAAMADAPAAVLAAALPPNARAGVPASLRDLVEQEVDITGTVDVLYEIHRQFVELRHTLTTPQGRLSLHVAGEPPAWLSGQTVRVRGVRVREAVAAAAGSTSTSGTVQAALPNVSGDQRTLMILVNFSDAPTEPYSLDYARSVLFSTTNGFMRENSSGALTLSGDVVGWYTIPLSSGVCDYSTLASQAQSAAASAGVNMSAYSRLVFGFPSNACGWWGLGSVGGNPSRSWVNGTLVLDVLGHELGHNLGLYHSHSLDCGQTPIGSSCTTSEYGDTLDIMGTRPGHFNAFQKERLGWLDAAQIASVNSGGTFTVEPYSSASGGLKALKIFKGLDASGRRTYYYVEFRQAIGYDAFMASWSNVMNGVAIRLGTESSPGSSYLLDMTPATASWYDPALAVGQSFTDTEAGVTLAVQSASASGAFVSVVLGPGTCTPQAPVVSIGSGQSTVAAGSAVSYPVQITNRDSVSCSPATLAVTPVVPSGWSAALSAASVAVAPGGTASTTLVVTSTVDAVPGSYTVGVQVLDPTEPVRAGAASSTYGVMAPRAASVSTDRATYTRSQAVLTSVRVTTGGVPVAGASVALQYRKADGRLVKATMTTDATGAAVHRLSLRKRDPVGPYEVTATTAGGPPATALFTVQ